MTETEITQVLQKDLSGFSIKPAVKQRQKHLHVLLIRPDGSQVDYPGLTQRVQTSLQSLPLTAVERVTVYGRLVGGKDYEWENSFNLGGSRGDGGESTVFYDDRTLAYGNRFDGGQTLMADDDDSPTQVYQPSMPMSRGVDPSDHTLVAPDPQRPAPGISIPQVVQPEVPSRSGNRSSKGGRNQQMMIMIGVGIAAAVLVLVLFLVLRG
ncbi:MAG: hypothetical protein NW237_09195 [Cyanobacteriota bacterium]|nr:hypothetical protein [Cyanobacteriota bacterium]